MGTGGSSSKRKRSSLKKKRSKNSVEVRKRKRDRSGFRNNKSKKSRRRDDSISSSDTEYSRSPVSYSSSSSDDDYRRRRSRSRARRNVRGGRKAARTSSSSPESRQDSIIRRKRKRSQKICNPDVKKKKKTYKKKPKRDLSSDSWSCSTCRSGTSGTESDYERSRGRSKRMDKDRKSREKVKSRKKRIRHRSRSSSACSLHSNRSGQQSEEILVVENNSRRLRSVITFVEEPDERDGKELNKSEEEIIYDHNECPCRSGDSNDGTSKKDMSYYSNSVPDKRGNVENIKGVEFFTEFSKDGKGAGVQHEESNHSINDVGPNNPCDEDTDDLESILRQKALENLKKFRGLKTCAKIPAEENGKSNDAEQFSSAEPELLESKSPKKDASIKAVGTTSATHGTIPKTGLDSTGPPPNENKISVKHNVLKSDFTKQHMNLPYENPATSLNAAAGIADDKSELGKPALTLNSTGTCSTLKQVLTSQSHTSKKADLLATKGSVEDNLSEATPTLACSNGSHIAQVHDVTSTGAPESSSTLQLTPGECNLNDPQVESKDGSQFEQKTMSVMRGGEMVQVNYKVYIPKKVSALGRRQLQR